VRNHTRCDVPANHGEHRLALYLGDRMTWNTRVNFSCSALNFAEGTR
jgi:hypothetical protein